MGLTTHTKKLHRQISPFLQLREAVIVFAAENRYGSEADLQQLRMQEDESLFVLGLQELLKAGEWFSCIQYICSWLKDVLFGGTATKHSIT
jgi:hypothetical protein